MSTVHSCSTTTTARSGEEPSALQSTELAFVSIDTPVEPKREYAVTVRNGYVQYGSLLSSLKAKKPPPKPVLSGFNMTVEKGHIYGLLGSSGCGKTTIMRAIVGERHLDAGKVSVLGHEPRAPGSAVPGTLVGYMPQELSLLENLTIYENLRFYGLIGGMSEKEIAKQIEYFILLLDLPDKHRVVSTLSGGQQRRVSFVIALLHAPPILVLDEPTVGVDPLLRENIWKYIRTLTKQNGTSVIISTHYIEEASTADTVGLMRFGKLIAEQSPQSLLQSLQCTHLEMALLKLCSYQSSVVRSSEEDTAVACVIPVKDDDVTSETYVHPKRDTTSSVRLRALTWRNTLILIRDHQYLFWSFALPALVAILCCSCIGGNMQDVRVSVFNQETNCTSLKMSSTYPIRTASNNRTLHKNCKVPNYFSCPILKELQDNGISSIYFRSEDSAKEYVRRGKSWGAVIFNQNFTMALIQRAKLLSGSYDDEEVVENSTIYLAMDQSDVVTSLYIQSQLTFALKKIFSDLGEECHFTMNLKDGPFQMNTPLHGSMSSTYGDFVLPGFIVSSTLMFSLIATGASLLPDKLEGTFDRSLVSGVTTFEILASHFIIQAIAVLLELAIMFTVAFGMFDHYNVGGIGTLTLITAPLALDGMLFGLIVATYCTNYTSAGLVPTAMSLTALLCSGAVWPLEALPYYVRQVFWLLPTTAPTIAMRHVLQRGWTLANHSVQFSLAISFIYLIVTCCVLFLAYRHRGSLRK